jgi:hypothetical protein
VLIPSITGNIENYTGDELDQNQSNCTQENPNYRYMNSTTFRLVQAFKPSLSILTRIELLLKASRNYLDGNVILSIRNDINGMDLTNVSVDAGNITTDYFEWIEFDFPDITVTPEETYYIVCNYYENKIAEWVYWGICFDVYYRGEAWQQLIEPLHDWIEIMNHEGNTFDFFFKTYGKNHPPGKPTIQGPTEGIKGVKYQYSFVSIDEDDDDLNYIVYWGGDNIEENIGPCPSGIAATVEHKWENSGTYYIEAKAIDSHGIESDWALLKISMPKTKTFNLPFSQFLENHPFIFKLLRQILEL